MMKTLLSLSLALASLSVAHAQEQPPSVSDATLLVAKDHQVTLTLSGNRELSGVPAAWDGQNVTLVEDGTRRIVTVARLDIVSIQMAAAPVVPQYVPQLAPPPTTSEFRQR